MIDKYIYVDEDTFIDETKKIIVPENYDGDCSRFAQCTNVYYEINNNADKMTQKIRLWKTESPIFFGMIETIG
jgi:hypothetical protein